MKNDLLPSVYNYHDLSEWLQSILHYKQLINHRFSIRALSKLLNVHHSSLVRVMNKKATLSTKNIDIVGKSLSLNETEIKYLHYLRSIFKKDIAHNENHANSQIHFPYSRWEQDEIALSEYFMRLSLKNNESDNSFEKYE